DETVLLNPLRVVLVAKGYRAQLRQIAAGVVHVVDVSLVARRRQHHTQLPGIAHLHRTSTRRTVKDPRDIGRGLPALALDSDANRMPLSGHTFVADIDV